MNVRLLIVLCIFGSFFSAIAYINPRIIELNDKFLEVKKGGYWLVMFYAPWCSYCKRLEPIWSHVQQALHHTGVRVCRVDCTTFSKTCRHFGVNSYPTIMFIRGDETEFTFNGERTKEEIVHFTMRVATAPVKTVRDSDIDKMKRENHIFFSYVGPQSGGLWDAFHHAAQNFHAQGYFFNVLPEIADKHFGEVNSPAVLVYKENTYYIFNENDWEGNLNTSLSNWVNTERFPTFIKITRLNLNIIMESSKYLVLAVVEENKIQQIPKHMLEFRNMVESVIINYRDRFHRVFQFGWTGSPDIANSIAIEKVPLPYFLVLNCNTSHHHIPDDEPHRLTPEAITIFLDSVQNKSAKVYGGRSFLMRIYRGYFEATTAFSDMWRGNPVLTTVIFGLPLGFLSLICYSTCCTNILDADDEDDEDIHEEVHEKKE